MMAELRSRLPVWRVMLVANEQVQGFYQSPGFERYPDVMVRLEDAELYDR
jgi:hypothetical protein